MHSLECSYCKRGLLYEANVRGFLCRQVLADVFLSYYAQRRKGFLFVCRSFEREWRMVFYKLLRCNSTMNDRDNGFSLLCSLLVCCASFSWRIYYHDVRARCTKTDALIVVLCRKWTLSPKHSSPLERTYSTVNVIWGGVTWQPLSVITGHWIVTTNHIRIVSYYLHPR